MVEEERALAPIAKASLRAARSLEDAKPDEIMYLGRRGQVLSPRRVKILLATTWTCVLASWIPMASNLKVFGPGTAVALGLGVGMVALQLRRFSGARTAYRLLVSGQWEEAHERFAALARVRLVARAYRRAVALNLAFLEHRSGRPEAALERLDRTLAATSRGWIATTKLHWFTAAFQRVLVLLSLDRLADAERQVAALHAEVARENKMYRGDYFQLHLEWVELALAVQAGDPARLPDDETLHAQARRALGRTAFGELLYYLGWAFARRGDDGMARHLLEEAPARVVRSSLPALAPGLQAWVDARRAEWGLA
jgi:hypothetical protein